MRDKPEGPLRRGWTTGACATAATAAAYGALVTGAFVDPVTITLPKGEQPSFSLENKELGDRWASASVIKDAGDDPDVTHGAEISVIVRHGAPGSGVTFHAGLGVGRITKPGLPLPPGEPAINPRPREMMRQTIADLAEHLGGPEDIEIEVSVPNGEVLAEQTWNPRLGIVGGISILGTTGIVIPYSCSAWIHSIHRGIDVARATGLDHVAGATGKVSEATVQAHYGLDDGALIDMGDFAGGMLKYLRKHPVRRVTVAGGFAKLAKLADGHLDLHSGRSQVDLDALATGLEQLGAAPDMVERARQAGMAGEVLEIAREADLPLADLVARRARQTALATLAGGIQVDVLVVDRQGTIIGQAVGKRVLVLGGTGEAVALAKMLTEKLPGIEVITSLAGVTRRPAPVPGTVRTGGFGGVAGLIAYLSNEHIDAVIDATHPFAAQIAANAAAACNETSTPRLKLLRAMWPKSAEDTWIEVADAHEAAAKLVELRARSVFVTLGLRDLHHFAGLKDTRFIVRLIEKPSAPLPLPAEIVTGRGPFDEAQDSKLMEEHGIDTLVTKASGGASTEGKILAARTLGLPVVMIRRPEPPDGEMVSTVDGALAWLESQLARSR